jgi:hypothetical protein
VLSGDLGVRPQAAARSYASKQDPLAVYERIIPGLAYSKMEALRR